MRDDYGDLRHTGKFLNDRSDEGSVSPHSYLTVWRPSAPSSGLCHFQGQGSREKKIKTRELFWDHAALCGPTGQWARKSVAPSLVGRSRDKFYHHLLEGVGRGQEVIWNNNFPDQSYIKELTPIVSLSPEVYGPLCNGCFSNPSPPPPASPSFTHSPGLCLQGLPVGLSPPRRLERLH